MCVEGGLGGGEGVESGCTLFTRIRERVAFSHLADLVITRKVSQGSKGGTNDGYVVWVSTKQVEQGWDSTRGHKVPRVLKSLPTARRGGGGVVGYVSGNFWDQAHCAGKHPTALSSLRSPPPPALSPCGAGHTYYAPHPLPPSQCSVPLGVLQRAVSTSPVPIRPPYL